MDRRQFLVCSGAAGLGLSLAGRLQAEGWKTKLYKALIGKPDEATFQAWKAAGFEGMESTQWDINPAQAEKARRLADKFGMKIHSVLRGWTNFNSSDPEQVKRDIQSVETALRAAEAYGADAVLLVPCRVGPPGMTIPEPWEFDIEFDDKTGHVQRVVKGDNTKYAEYIKAHNHAIDTSRAAVEKLIPTAEKTKVVIALENVWNNLWVLPNIFAHFVRSFGSPWVRAYFDIGNHVKYAPPEKWIRTLGDLIVKCHVKDFLLNPDGRGGKFVHPRDGSVNWPEVRKALDEVGYNGWMTIEDGGLSLEEFSRRLDLIIAGK
ncbi:MAG: sugar phosphate isomerase/epimerase [Thermoguttaceae bacterium]|nr:sugar phosphate isomerase/epimerase [Thermoguttaceae bacterium]MDW8036411.1 sugar phosphate isomerase/epimerase family protein [Thermoguttaceae bacterium]